MASITAPAQPEAAPLPGGAGGASPFRPRRRRLLRLAIDPERRPQGAGDRPRCRAGGAQQPHHGLHRARPGGRRTAPGGCCARRRNWRNWRPRAEEPLSGRLRLGVIPTIAPYLLPRTLPMLRKAYPKLQLYLTEDQTARLLALLEDGTLDLVLLALPYHADSVETLPLFKDGFQLVAPQGQPAGAEEDRPPPPISRTPTCCCWRRAIACASTPWRPAACRRPTAALPAPASIRWWRWWPAASASRCCPTWRWRCTCRRPANWWRGRSIVRGLGVRSDWRGARRQVGPRNSRNSARP